MDKSDLFSQKVKIFHDRRPPEEGVLAGYAVLIEVLWEAGIRVPLPDRLALISEKHQRYEDEQWQVFTPRHKPEDTLAGHLYFALKYEGLDLYILKAVFKHQGPDAIRIIIEKEPTGQYSRRLWFLYEWLLDSKLEVSDPGKVAYIDVVDNDIQYSVPGQNSTRHKVRNNLPGTREFCPMIRRTEKLDRYIASKLNERVDQGLSQLDRNLVRRAAAFLLLKDSKASFAIEGEFPADARARNWGKIIGEAGKHPISIAEIERLQHIVIGSKKLSQMGLRTGEGFIGEHDSDTFSPVPDHISAKAADLPSLMQGLIETEARLRDPEFDPVLAATMIAFGFVFIHPLLDGNGRIHRYLIHHLIAAKGYVRRDMIFPVSACMYDKLADYQDVLEAYSHPRVNMIEWKEDDKHNVTILNETIDLYRYYDLTRQAEYLYQCVETTIDQTIPDELDYLRRYDATVSAINEQVSLPDQLVDLLIKMLQQNQGKLSKAKRDKFFAELDDEQVDAVEKTFAEYFMK
jgi:Fic family protein